MKDNQGDILHPKMNLCKMTLLVTQIVMKWPKKISTSSANLQAIFEMNILVDLLCIRISLLGGGIPDMSKEGGGNDGITQWTRTIAQRLRVRGGTSATVMVKVDTVQNSV